VTEFEQLALQFAVAPGRVLLRQPQEQLLDLGVRSWAARLAPVNDGRFTADQRAVPFKQGIRLEEEGHLVQAVMTDALEGGEFGSKDSQGQLIPARNPRLVWLLALENTQLLAEQQDFEIFVAPRALGMANRSSSNETIGARRR
jgi:hypothetical protein